VKGEATGAVPAPTADDPRTSHNEQAYELVIEHLKQTIAEMIDELRQS
jgi:hypothetical protein